MSRGRRRISSRFDEYVMGLSVQEIMGECDFSSFSKIVFGYVDLFYFVSSSNM